MQALDKNSGIFFQMRESIQLYISFNTTQSRESIATHFENRFRSYAVENTGYSFISLDEEMCKLLAPVQFIWGKFGRFTFYGAGSFILSIYFFLPVYKGLRQSHLSGFILPASPDFAPIFQFTILLCCIARF